MRVVLQRVDFARVLVQGQVTGQINQGLLIYVGIENKDSEDDVVYMAEKIMNLRIFSDDNQKMNLCIKDISNAKILSISQFTLSSYIRKGRRPDFTNAKEPAQAKALWLLLNNNLAQHIPVETGIFGAMMKVESINDGPVTFIIEK
jgi:D-tyrosyl-tRNA(Tyr) deacylase